jgi:hypothetical protein
MRVVIDLDTDSAGRPVGSLRICTASEAETFDDWLDLLRALEACVEQSRADPAGSVLEQPEVTET